MLCHGEIKPCNILQIQAIGTETGKCPHTTGTERRFAVEGALGDELSFITFKLRTFSIAQGGMQKFLKIFFG